MRYLHQFQSNKKIGNFDMTNHIVDPLADSDYSKYGFADPEIFVFRSPKGLNKDVIREMSAMKEEPEWLLNFRLKSFDIYLKKPMPTWGADISNIDFDNIPDTMPNLMKNNQNHGMMFQKLLKILLNV